MAHLLTKELKESVLQTAIEGKLSNKNCTDTPVQSTLKKIKELQDSLFKNKIEKPTKPTREVNDIELFEIPEHWQWVELSQIGTMTRGSGIKKTEVTQTGFPCVRYGQLYTTFKEKFDKAVSFVPEDIFNSCKKAHQGDILMSLTGENNFDIALAVVYEGLEEIAIGGDMMKLSNHCMNPYYLSFVLNSEYGINWKRKMAKGNIIVHISNDKLANIMIPTPPIEEQARIVAKVDEIMAKIDEYEKLENQLVKLKEQFPQDMKDSLLQAGMMGKLTEQYHSEHSPLRNLKNDTSEYDSDLPSNWSVAKMMTVSELYTGNSISESIKKSKYTGLSSGYNYIGTKDVGFDCSIAYNNGVKIPYDEPKFKIAKKHSTLLCIEGGSAGKKVGITSEDVCFGNKLCSFNAREYINYKFQFYVIQSPTFKKVFIQNKSGMIGGVSIKKLKEILIPLPPIEEQQRIVDKLDELLPLVEHLSSMN